MGLLTGFLPPFRLGGKGMTSIADSTENSELARMLQFIVKESMFSFAGVSMAILLLKKNNGQSNKNHKNGISMT